MIFSGLICAFKPANHHRHSFESSTVTYQVQVSSRQQASIGNSYSFNQIITDTPNKLYGDRFIAGKINDVLYSSHWVDT